MAEMLRLQVEITIWVDEEDIRSAEGFSMTVYVTNICYSVLNIFYHGQVSTKLYFSIYTIDRSYARNIILLILT